MKSSSILFFLISIFLSHFTFCQNKKVPLIKHEIGTGFGIPSNSAVTDNKPVEIIYKKRKDNSRALRFMIGHTEQSQPFSSRYYAMSDTVYFNRISNKFRYFFVGTGVEMQRNFYKLLYLTASVDTRFMYANSIMEHNNNTLYYGEYTGYQQSESRLKNTGVFKWELNPSFGIRLQTTHFSMGIEVTSRMMSLFVPSSKSKLNTLFDFNMGHDFNRICFNYRF